MLGTNDAKPQNWSHKADFAGDYNSMLDHYRALGALVYVALPLQVHTTSIPTFFRARSFRSFARLQPQQTRRSSTCFRH